MPRLRKLGFHFLDAKGKEGKLRCVQVAAVNVEAEHEAERVAGADFALRRYRGGLGRKGPLAPRAGGLYAVAIITRTPITWRE